MNAHAPIDPVDTNMTSKGQVLIPKAIRDRVGLVPNSTVQVALNEAGEVVVRAKPQNETLDQRRARIRASIEALVGTLNTGFASTDEYMDFIRPHRLEDW
jgi:antitoxin PrlF